MTRSFFLIFCLITSVITMKGQIAKWLIQPEYDNISIADNQDIIITELNGVKQLWDFNGQQLSSKGVNDIIHPFSEGYAVVTSHDGGKITGFYNTNGAFTSLNSMVAHSSTQFNDGYLLTQNGEYYGFVDTHGTVRRNNLIEAQPFSSGYASCRAYKNFEKKKDPYPMLLSANNLEEVVFNYNGNVIKNDDVDFISSVNHDDIGIVIIKDKVYLFNGQSRNLSPLYASKNGSADKKDKQVKIQSLPEITGNGLQIMAYDKQRTVSINFDDMLAPVSIRFANGETQDYNKPVVPPRVFTSELRPTQERYNPQSDYGLNWGEDIEVLPPQLQRIGVCFDNNAIVQLNGKWGLLRVFKDESFDVSLNKGNYIAFKHKTTDVPIRLNVPARISTAKTKLEIVNNGNDEDISSCRLFSQTAKATQSYDGILPGYIDYECELDYPPYIPDEISKDDMSMNEIKYQAQVAYENLKSPIILIKTYGWQYKYITPIKSEEVIQNGNYSCKIELKRDKDPGEQTYPIEVTINSDTLFNEITKISDNLYTVTVNGLNEGVNTFEVTLSEGDDEIPIDTSFEIEVTYEKPSRKITTPQPVKSTIRPKKVKRSAVKQKNSPKKENDTWDPIWH